MDKTRKNNCYFIYTLLFIFITPLVFITFLIGNKSLIWNSDGIRQHYIALMHFGNWGREIINNFFSLHTFKIPLWDFHIGYGSDIITTMHYYVIGDPLNILSFFVPESFTEYLYQALIILRLYLSGISFLYYCRQMKKGQIASVGGAINYTFCGFMLYGGIRHPFFMNPMIYLPLLCAGIEKIFKRRNPCLFIITVFLSAMSNFYFFYMIAFAACFYIAVRFFSFPHEKIWKDILLTAGRFTSYAAIGICMSFFILLPVLLAFFSTNRSNTPQAYPLLYKPGYYAKLLANFIKPHPVGEWTVLGFTAPAFFSVMLMLSSKKRKYKLLKISFLVMTAMLCIPFCGKALNGFSYVSNRWCFIYAALVSYILTSVWNDMAMLFSKTTICTKNKNKGIRYISAYFLFFSILHVFINACYLYSTNGKDYASEFLPSGKAYENIIISTPKALQLTTGQETSFFRYETDDFTNMNASAVIGGHSVEYYWSLENSVIPDYYMDMSIKFFNVFNYKDLDHRTFLDALSGIKYFASTKSSSIPYGFDYIGSVSLSEKKQYEIFKNRFFLPLGYTYSSFIPLNEYENMDSAKRQEALLQGIVIDTGDTTLQNQFPVTHPVFDSTKIEFTTDYGKDAALQPDGTIKTSKNKSKIKLSFNGMENCETYLLLEDVKMQTDDIFQNEFVVNVKSNDSKNQMRYMTPNHRNYKGQVNYLINLGYHENPQTKMTITFPYKGKYKIGSIKIICQPMENYKKYINTLKEEVLEDEYFGTNIVKGKINLKENKILCLAIPYSKGWHAWVDGEKSKLLRANKMFMALPLKKGEHTIYLEYQTPGLVKGSIISVIGGLLFIRIWFNYKIKKSNGVK